MGNGAPPRGDWELLLKLYESNVGLFTHFLELVLKLNIFYYAVTGAIFSFYFSRLPELTGRPERPLAAALVFVVVMSIGFGSFCCYAASRVQYLDKPTEDYQRRLEAIARPDLKGVFNPTPEMKVLTWAIVTTAILLFAIAALTMAYLTWALCH